MTRATNPDDISLLDIMLQNEGYQPPLEEEEKGGFQLEGEYTSFTPNLSLVDDTGYSAAEDTDCSTGEDASCSVVEDSYPMADEDIGYIDGEPDLAMWKTPALQERKTAASTRRKTSSAKSKRKVVAVVALAVVICLVGALSAALALGIFGNIAEVMAMEEIRLEFEGESEFVINVGDEIPAPLVKVYVNDELADRSFEVTGMVDNSYPGVYEVKYALSGQELVSRVTVIDDIPPEIKLKGNKKTVLLEGEEYQESGYEASDNVDGDLTDKVVITGEVKAAIGTYTLTYSVTDSSGNEAFAERTVAVNKKLVPQQAAVEKKEPPKKTAEASSDEITSMSFTATGINVTAKYASSVESFSLVNTSTGNETAYKVTKSDTTYTALLNLTELANGTYDLYLNNSAGTREKMVNKMEYIHRIGRAKIGGKLVTANYADNNVSITIENHAYKYDIIIDVGHGGVDPGAVNTYIKESVLNLEISRYEKERYQAHGLNVLLNRNGVDLELGMGPSPLVELHRRSYALGYYGAVSRFVYSNHHNSSTSATPKGYEIIVPAALPASDLAVEHAVANAWDKVFDLSGDSRNRFYTKNYDTDAYYNKRNGEVYTFNNWYAINRIPYNLFNVKASIYEGCYISNPSEFDWYYFKENWHVVSEAKIKVYVEALGKTYVPPKE
ncbi:MAG: DUF5011 domain-containing protein [Peptococcaceae bacterium]|nr:DUF5011 domain-containing protein [Peptococcaceae bacterium]